MFSCTTKSIETNNSVDTNSTSELGLKFSKIEKEIGKPSETNIEKYGSDSFNVLEYYDKNQHPKAFYTVDKNDIVISKSTWVQPEQKTANLNWILKNQFPHQKFLVDQDHGVFIGYQGQRVLLISQSSPELTVLRINQFKSKCPSLQE